MGWSKGLDSVLHSHYGKLYFKQYLASVNAISLICFWVDVDEFRHNPVLAEHPLQTAIKIFDMYVRVGGLRELPSSILSEERRLAIAQAIQAQSLPQARPTLESCVFINNAAQIVVYENLESHHFASFLKSPVYEIAASAVHSTKLSKFFGAEQQDIVRASALTVNTRADSAPSSGATVAMTPRTPNWKGMLRNLMLSLRRT
eukprot:TRINITY_DN5963_c0_g1_i7.p2 TRINITY_DN5963_c0_g1~~TRINITY_DN5963_c0_g1_i7.p2  ORF type:complete len:202 (-),score=46.52 TRINITY_DN5963_c0_g1_i7:451-1056(-)